MALFRRKKSESDEAPAVEADVVQPPPPPPATTGPWDIDDVDDELPRLDLGSLRVPVPDGVEVRVEVDEAGQVAAAVVVDRGNQMQLNVFAAARNAPIWSEVREELRAALGTSGAPEDATGPFGAELRARIPGERPGVTTPARFIGVDGPRWFVRGLVTGPAATDAAQADRLHEVFRSVVVVRGKEAMAPRDALPLHLPREVTQAAQAQSEIDAEHGTDPGLNPFERGPEITEVR